MSDDLAAMGSAPWLPLSVQRAQAAEEQAERRQAREAERQRAESAEARRSANLEMYRQQAWERGEEISALAFARGEVAGRSLSDIFAGAIAAADREDARAGSAARRGRGESLNLVMHEIPVSRGKPLTRLGREVASTVRKFAEAHPDADVIGRAMLAREARKAYRR